MSNYWENYAKKMEVEILEIKKAGWFQRFASINNWNVKAKYKNRTFKLTAWAGKRNISLDSIYYDVVNQIENLIELEKFNVDIKRFAVYTEGVKNG